MIPINTQPVEGLQRDTSYLDVFKLFPTIQGEGPHAGRPATFVRFAGCNLQCPGCDTDYTSTRRRYAPRDLLFEVNRITRLGNGQRPLVVITGGEPLRQDITKFTVLLCAAGYDVQIETNGILAPPILLPDDVMVVLSPKSSRVHPRTAIRAYAWKYVLTAGSVDTSDGLPLSVLGHAPGAAGRVARPPAGARVYVQPADQGDEHLNELNLRAAIESCMRFGYTLQLQLHKLINME